MFLHLGGCLAHLSEGELRVDEHFGHHGLGRNTQGRKILFSEKQELCYPVSKSGTQTEKQLEEKNIFSIGGALICEYTAI